MSVLAMVGEFTHSGLEIVYSSMVNLFPKSLAFLKFEPYVASRL